jgi:choline dehydrogenase
MGGRRVYHARGKVLGGSSSINGMIFQRGNPMDYERWAAEDGMSQWDYHHCLPYFRRMETWTAGSSPWRGDDGPLVLERGPAVSPLFQAFFKAVREVGFDLTDDVNGFKQEGFAPFDRNIKNGRRFSASQAYLHPVMNRPNLRVLTHSYVSKIVFEGNRAVGVDFTQLGRRRSRRARAAEIILCGGAINSPHLLQLSGVGDSEHLNSVGIDVLHHLPGVGQNLQDHLEVYVQHACTQPVSEAPALLYRNRPSVFLNWLLRHSGPGATNHFEGGGFARSNDAVDYPNLMFHFLPIAIRYDGSAPASEHGYQVHIGPMYADTRGSVLAKSADPGQKPALRFNYLSTENDRKEWVEAIHTARRILGAPAFEEYSGGELSPGPQVETDEQILDWVARDAETALHPSCTCKMGVDEMAVTDPGSMRVHGLDGLRVVDASVFPYVTNANIYSPTMMVAEKAADLILGNTPLEPDMTEYYRRPAVAAQSGD